MKAVRIHEHGGVDKLLYEDVEKPVAGYGDVIVRVRACALNHLDIWVRQGLPGIKIPLPHILGSDISGEVEETGEGVGGIKKGDKVILSPGFGCGRCEACVSGTENICQKYDILGYRCDGGYAEYIKVPDRIVYPMPEKLSYVESAAVPLVFLTAWHMLVTRANIRPGDWVLVLGAGSGVGSAAIQIARLFGARVIATAGREEKLKKARELGAEETINHYKEDISERVKEITNRNGVDIVFEHVGPATWEKGILCLKKRGKIVTCGATTGPTISMDLRYVFTRELSIIGCYMGTRQDFINVMKFIARGSLKPIVHTTIPLKEAVKAHKIMEKSEHFGKIVLSV